MTLFDNEIHKNVWQEVHCHSCFEPNEMARRLHGQNSVCPIWAKATSKPVNVRIIRGDTGVEVPCELVHDGVDEDGMDQWLIANVTFRIGIDELRVGVLPPRTGIGVDTDPSWKALP